MLRSAQTVAASGLLALCLASTGAQADEDGAWSSIADSLFGERPLLSSAVVSLEAPYRAQDAAVVPMTITTDLPDDDPRHVRRIVLVIDENPAPVAATFELGPDSGVSFIATRVRVNAYTPVHAVAELSDGTLHVTEAFVKASGGCSAPASKDPEEAMANLGRMKLRQFPPTAADAPGGRTEAQLLLRHPNHSGLQMDQLTRYYTPAHFVREVTISQGDNLILRMEGGISLSEDPSFRFDFDTTGNTIQVEATDTEGNVFREEWAVGAS